MCTCGPDPCLREIRVLVNFHDFREFPLFKTLIARIQKFCMMNRTGACGYGSWAKNQSSGGRHEPVGGLGAKKKLAGTTVFFGRTYRVFSEHLLLLD